MPRRQHALPANRRLSRRHDAFVAERLQEASGIKGAAFHWQACRGGCRCPQRRDMRTMRDITTPLADPVRCGLALRACLARRDTLLTGREAS
jgi:hypothetical protein